MSIFQTYSFAELPGLPEVLELYEVGMNIDEEVPFKIFCCDYPFLDLISICINHGKTFYFDVKIDELDKIWELLFGENEKPQIVQDKVGLLKFTIADEVLDLANEIFARIGITKHKLTFHLFELLGFDSLRVDGCDLVGSYAGTKYIFRMEKKQVAKIEISCKAKSARF